MLDQPVADLGLHAAVDADDAPRDVVVDRRALPGQPDERDDREPAGRRDVQEVLAVGVRVAELVLRRQPAVDGEQALQALRDRVRIVDQALGIVDEGGRTRASSCRRRRRR